jgi:hypothetical protein
VQWIREIRERCNELIRMASSVIEPGRLNKARAAFELENSDKERALMSDIRVRIDRPETRRRSSSPSSGSCTPIGRWSSPHTET